MARVSRMRARLSTPGPASILSPCMPKNRVWNPLYSTLLETTSQIKTTRGRPMANNGGFLTTHVGSLPRPDDLIEMMWAREDGVPVDRAAMEERVRRAVDEVVARQTKTGIDIINDGEWAKPSYATYIKDRLNGFGGTGNTFVFQDIEAFPQTKARVFADPGRKHRKTPACDAPISVRDAEAPRKDVARLKAALKAHDAARAFLTAASPGVIAFFFRNPITRLLDYPITRFSIQRRPYPSLYPRSNAARYSRL